MIKMMFKDLYEDCTHKNFRATKEYSDKDIDKAITLH